jgi:hypothetical protein
VQKTPNGWCRPEAVGCGSPNQSQKSIEAAVRVVATSGLTFSDWMPKKQRAGIAPARGPPLWDMPDAGAGTFDRRAQPAPEYEFDQRIAW